MIPRVLRRASIGAAALALSLTALAVAKAGDRPFEQTYPVASALCAKADAGTLGKRLAPSLVQVRADCATLRSAFPPLQSAVLTAQASFTSGVAAARASIAQACQVRPSPACRQARQQGRATIQGLRRQHRAAVLLYYTSVEVNRRTFWAAIRALRGGNTVTADKPIQKLSS